MTNEERAADAVEHLQAAARELIAAARAALDVAEDLIEHPDSVLALLGDLAAPFAGRGRSAARDDAAPERDDGAPEAPRVQHIRVS